MNSKKSMIIVSACLAGVACRYDGKDNYCQKVVDLIRQGTAIPVCPEQLGGLPTARPAAERRGNKVVTKDGNDVTEQFLNGAREALKIAQLAGVKIAILKARSPSCGKDRIYDGTFTKTLVSGNGVFAQACQENGIKVITEEELLNNYNHSPLTSNFN